MSVNRRTYFASIIILACLLGVVGAALLRRASHEPRLGLPSPQKKIEHHTASPRNAVEGAQGATTYRLGVTVCDGISRAPLAAVRVSLFHPTLYLADVEVKRNFAFSYDTPSSSVRIHGASAPPNEVDSESLEAFEVPDSGETPVLSAETSRDGTVDLILPEDRLTLNCTCPGYVPRNLKVQFHGSGAKQLTVEMFKGMTVSGRVERVDGVPISESVDLSFFAVTDPPEWAGRWSTSSKSDGGFSLIVGAKYVVPKVTSLGWILSMPVRPIEASSPEVVVLKVLPVATIRVIDAVDRTPLERFALILRRAGTQWPVFAGPVIAPKGVFPLVDQLLSESYQDTLRRSNYTLTVWAPDHVITEVSIASVFERASLEIPLNRGVPPSIAGTVRRAGDPQSGLTIHLRTSTGGTADWTPSNLFSVARCQSDKNGDFALQAPIGTYILHFIVTGQEVSEAVSVPSSGLIIDLSTYCKLRVHVRDRFEKGVGEHVVEVKNGTTQRRWAMRTKESGLAEFDTLPPGEYLVSSPETVSLDGSSPPLAVTLTRSQQMDVEFRTLEDNPEPPMFRAVVKGIQNLYGWRLIGPNSEAVALTESDTLAVKSSKGILEVQSPDGSRWRFSIPQLDRKNAMVEVDMAGPCYEGKVSDWRTGKPLPAVTMRLKSSKRFYEAIVRTDSEGVFQARGLDEGSYVVEFEGTEFDGITYWPARPPSRPSTRLNIPLPIRDEDGFRGIATRPIEVLVRTRANTEPPQPTLVTVYSIHPTADGQLHLLMPSAEGFTKPDGTVSLIVPSSIQYSIRVIQHFGKADSNPTYCDWKAGTATGPEHAAITTH